MVEEHYCKFPDNIFQSVFKPHKFQHCFRLESTVYDKVFYSIKSSFYIVTLFSNRERSKFINIFFKSW